MLDRDAALYLSIGKIALLQKIFTMDIFAVRLFYFSVGAVDEICLRVKFVFDNMQSHFNCISLVRIMHVVRIHLIYCGKEFLDVA